MICHCRIRNVTNTPLSQVKSCDREAHFLPLKNSLSKHPRFDTVSLGLRPKYSIIQFLSLHLFFFFFSTIFIGMMSHHAYAQIKGDYNWIGGFQRNNVEGGRMGFKYNFNKKPPAAEYIPLKYGFDRNIASISDDQGELLFYTNGCAVMNRYHEVMPHGDSINAGRFFETFWRGDCNYGYPGKQEIMILPDPNYNKGYYIIHKAFMIYDHSTQDSIEMRYSYVDMTLDQGRGDVTLKNIRYYYKEDVLMSFLTAISHSNQKDWWIVQPLSVDSTIAVFLLNKNGPHLKSVQNSSQIFNSAGGVARFSPDGRQYAIYTYRHQLHIYDFDRNTGELSNHTKVTIIPQDSLLNQAVANSLEWSPSGRFIYVNTILDLYQLDTWDLDAPDALMHIATYDGFINPFATNFYMMHQSPDCKIILTPGNGTYSLHVIHKPDEKGKACDFVQNGIVLPNSNSGGLPNFPRFRVDEDEKCDPTISSILGESMYYRRDLEVYPSPSEGRYTVKIPENMTSGYMRVLSIQGELVFNQYISHSSIAEIDITARTAGMYVIEWYPDTSQQIFYSRQVVKL